MSGEVRPFLTRRRGIPFASDSSPPFFLWRERSTDLGKDLRESEFQPRGTCLSDPHFIVRTTQLADWALTTQRRRSLNGRGHS